MKKNYLIIAFVTMLAFSFVGCKKDNEEPENISLIGRWDATSTKIELFVNNVSSEKTEKTYTTNEAYLIFKTGNVVDLYNENEFEESANYTYSGNKLVFDYGNDDKEEFNVKNLTAKTFTIFVNESIVVDGKTERIEIEVNFSKQ